MKIQLEKCPRCGGKGVIQVQVIEMATTKTPARMLGQVKNIRDRAKGFIFISGDDVNEAGQPIARFCHKSSVGDDVNFDALREGDRVSFVAVQGNKGPRAENVRLAASEA